MDPMGGDDLGYDIPPLMNQPPQVFGGYNPDGTPIPPMVNGQYFDDGMGGSVGDDSNDAKRRRIARVSCQRLVSR